MEIKTYEIKEEEVRRTLEESLASAPYRFHLTDGHIAHIDRAEREARKRARRRKWRRRA